MRLFLLLIVFMPIGANCAPTDKAVIEFFKDKTKIENPSDLRDPFKSPIKPDGPNQRISDSEKNYARPNDEQMLTGTNIQDIRVVGVLIGKERRAVVQTEKDDKSPRYFLKEGMKIGPDQAEVKAILPGGIVLVEKIVNVYGQEEYLETVIPISR